MKIVLKVNADIIFKLLPDENPSQSSSLQYLHVVSFPDTHSSKSSFKSTAQPRTICATSTKENLI